MKGYYTEGERDGLWLNFNGLGELREEETYDYGVLDGPTKKWYPGEKDWNTKGSTFLGKRRVIGFSTGRMGRRKRRANSLKTIKYMNGSSMMRMEMLNPNIIIHPQDE